MRAEDLEPPDDLVRRDKYGNRLIERVCAYEPCSKITWMRKDRGKYCSRSCSGLSHSYGYRGENNPRWTGDAATYHAQHLRVRRMRGPADRCIHTNAIQCTSMTFNWAWIHGEDRNDVYSYVPLCASCHNHYDQASTPKPSVQGIKNGRAVLTEEIVLACRQRNTAGESQRALAREFRVSQSTMRRAITPGQLWKHVPTTISGQRWTPARCR